MPTTPDLPEPPSFEDALRELEDTVDRLAAGELPLEESLALFEKGVGSLKRCHAILDKAEKRVQVLVQGVDGSPELRDATPSSGTPSRPLTPISARKKSGKQSIDADSPARQNATPCKQPEPNEPDRQPRPANSWEQGRSPSDAMADDNGESGLGGSLFGVAQ